MYTLFIEGFTNPPYAVSNNIIPGRSTKYITCSALKVDTTVSEITSVPAAVPTFLGKVYSTPSAAGITLSATTAMNSQLATATITINSPMPISATGAVILSMPKNNKDYTSPLPVGTAALGSNIWPSSYFQALPTTATASASNGVSFFLIICRPLLTQQSFILQVVRLTLW